MCLSVCNGSGKFRGRTTVVMHDLRTYYTLYCVWVITSGWTQGAWTQLGSSSWSGWSWGAAAEVDTIREGTQSGNSSWSSRKQDTVWCDHTRLVLARDTTAQGCWCVRVGAAPDSHRHCEGGETSEDLRSIPTVSFLIIRTKLNNFIFSCTDWLDLRKLTFFPGNGCTD